MEENKDSLKTGDKIAFSIDSIEFQRECFISVAELENNKKQDVSGGSGGDKKSDNKNKCHAFLDFKRTKESVFLIFKKVEDYQKNNKPKKSNDDDDDDDDNPIGDDHSQLTKSQISNGRNTPITRSRSNTAAIITDDNHLGVKMEDLTGALKRKSSRSNLNSSHGSSAHLDKLSGADNLGGGGGGGVTQTIGHYTGGSNKKTRKTSEHKSGDPIYYDDKVFFQNFDGNYLSVSGEGNNKYLTLLEEMDEDSCLFKISSKSYESSRPVLNNDKAFIAIYHEYLEIAVTEVNIKLSFKDYGGDLFKINLSNDISMEINALENNEPIFLSHREGGYLSVQDQKLLFTNSNKVNHELYDSLFELERVDSYQDKEEDMLFKIKSLSTNKYLSIQSQTSSGSHNRNPVVLVDEKDSDNKNSIMKFITRKDQQQQQQQLNGDIENDPKLYYNQHYFIKSLNDQYLHFQLNSESFNFVGHVQQLKYDDFQIKKPPFDSFERCKSLLSHISNLKKIEEVLITFKAIIGFFKGNRNSDNIKMLKDLFIKNLEQILQVCKSISPSKAYQPKVVIQLYNLLTMLSKGSSHYGLLIMNFYYNIKQFINNNQQSTLLKVHFVTLLNSIYKNNKILIESLSESKVLEFIDILSGVQAQEKDKDFLALKSEVIKLCNNFCICQRVEITKNQFILANIHHKRSYLFNKKTSSLDFITFKIEPYQKTDLDDDDDELQQESDEFEETGYAYSEYFKRFGYNKKTAILFKTTDSPTEEWIDGTKFDDDLKKLEKVKYEYCSQSLILYCNLFAGGMNPQKVIKDLQLTKEQCESLIYSKAVINEIKYSIIAFLNCFTILPKNLSYLEMNYSFDPRHESSRVEKLIENTKITYEKHEHRLKKEKPYYEDCSLCGRSQEGYSEWFYECQDCTSYPKYTLCERCAMLTQSELYEEIEDEFDDTIKTEKSLTIDSMKYYLVENIIHPHPMLKTTPEMLSKFYYGKLTCGVCNKEDQEHGYHCTTCCNYDICSDCFNRYKHHPNHSITETPDQINLYTPFQRLTLTKNLISTLPKSKTITKEDDKLLSTILKLLKLDLHCNFTSYTYKYIMNLFEKGYFENREGYIVDLIYSNRKEEFYHDDDIVYFDPLPKLMDLALQLHQKNLFELFIFENQELSGYQLILEWKRLFEFNLKLTDLWKLPEYFLNTNVKNENFVNSFIHSLKSQNIENHLLIRDAISNNNHNNDNSSRPTTSANNDTFIILIKLLTDNCSKHSSGTDSVQNNHLKIIESLKTLNQTINSINDNLNDMEPEELKIYDYFYSKVHPLLLTLIRIIGSLSHKKVIQDQLQLIYDNCFTILFNPGKLGSNFQKKNIELLIEISITNGDIFGNNAKLLEVLERYNKFQDSIYIDILMAFIFSSKPEQLNPFYLELLSKIAKPSKSTAILKNQNLITNAFLQYQNIIKNFWFISKDNIVANISKFSKKQKQSLGSNITLPSIAVTNVPSISITPSISVNNNNNNNVPSSPQLNSSTNTNLLNENNLKNILNFIKLLSSCCAGESSEAELIARKFISIDNCIETLVELTKNTIISNRDNQILYDFQKSYIFLLYEVYFNSKILLKYSEIPYKTTLQLFKNFDDTLQDLAVEANKLEKESYKLNREKEKRKKIERKSKSTKRKTTKNNLNIEAQFNFTSPSLKDDEDDENSNDDENNNNDEIKELDKKIEATKEQSQFINELANDVLIPMFNMIKSYLHIMVEERVIEVDNYDPIFKELVESLKKFFRKIPKESAKNKITRYLEEFALSDTISYGNDSDDESEKSDDSVDKIIKGIDKNSKDIDDSKSDDSYKENEDFEGFNYYYGDDDEKFEYKILFQALGDNEKYYFAKELKEFLREMKATGESTSSIKKIIKKNFLTLYDSMRAEEDKEDDDNDDNDDNDDDAEAKKKKAEAAAANINSITFENSYIVFNKEDPTTAHNEEYIYHAMSQIIDGDHIGHALKVFSKTNNSEMVHVALDILKTIQNIKGSSIKDKTALILLKILKKSNDVNMIHPVLKGFNSMLRNQSKRREVLDTIKFKYKMNPDNHLFRSIHEIICHCSIIIRSLKNPEISDDAIYSNDIHELPKELDYCIQVFNFIGLLCQGKNNFIQQNILYQPSNYNIYRDLVDFLIELSVKFVKSNQSSLHYHMVAISFFRCLKDIANSNPDNQQLLSNSKITSSIYEILSIDFSSRSALPDQCFLILNLFGDEESQQHRYKRKFMFVLLKKVIIDLLAKRIDKNNPILVRQTINELNYEALEKCSLYIKDKAFTEDFKAMDDELKTIDEIDYKYELRNIFYPKSTSIFKKTKSASEWKKKYQKSDSTYHKGKDYAVGKFLTISVCYFIQELINNASLKHQKLLTFNTDLLNSVSTNIGRVEMIYRDNIECIYYPIPHYINKNETKVEKKESTVRQILSALKFTFSENEIANKNQSNKIYKTNSRHVHFQKDLEEFFYDEKADWEQPTEKIDTFMDWAKYTLFKIENRNIFIEKSRAKTFFYRMFHNFRLISFILALTINFILLAYSKGSPGTIEEDMGNLYRPVMTVLSVIHILVSITTLISFYVKNMYIRFYKELDPIDLVELSYQNPDQIDYRNVITLTAIYYILAVVFSILGTVFNPFFFSFHIFQYSLNTEALTVMIKEVSKHTKTLAILFVFLVQTAYLMSIFSYLFFTDRYIDESGNPVCGTLATCFVTNLYYGIVQGGAMIDKMRFETFILDSNERVGEVTGWIIFNLVFWIIVTIVLLNVILGIIVDALGNMRDKKSDFQRYKNTNCFICSINRDTFQQNELDFDNHIEIEHNKWSYLYYYEYLKNRNRFFLRDGLTQSKLTPRKAMEVYFYKQISDGKYAAIFPIEKALSIDNKENK